MTLTTHHDAGTLRLQLAGVWRLGPRVPAVPEIAGERVCFDTAAVEGWDSTLVSFAARVIRAARAAAVTVDRAGLPVGVQRLLALAEATHGAAARKQPRPSLVARIGLRTLGAGKAVRANIDAIGELAIALGRLAAGTARFRRRDLWVQVQAVGPGALGIVGLVSGLVGLIVAFISAVQLQTFGAQLYVANLVGIAMVRELGAVMAGIVVAGRTGAAFAAELGTMTVTQERDALVTLGLSPFEFLVLPRVLAVTLMLPVLCVYADLMGVVGGGVVGIFVMHVSPRLYLDQTIGAVSITDLVGGIVKATTYGFLVGAAGCFIGLRSGRSAAAVGRAATSAVVAGIVLVIAACGAFAVLFYRLGL